VAQGRHVVDDGTTLTRRSLVLLKVRQGGAGLAASPASLTALLGHHAGSSVVIRVLVHTHG